MRPHARNNLGNRGCRRVKFRSYGTVGYGPTMWDKSRRSGDILHGQDSQACQRVACQLCRQQRRYQGWGTKRTIFPARWTRRANRQSSHPSMVTGMSTIIITGSYWQIVHRGVYISRELLLLISYRSQKRFNQTNGKGKMTIRLNRSMERKMCLNTYFRGISFTRTNRTWYPWHDIK